MRKKVFSGALVAVAAAVLAGPIAGASASWPITRFDPSAGHSSSFGSSSISTLPAPIVSLPSPGLSSVGGSFSTGGVVKPKPFDPSGVWR